MSPLCHVERLWPDSTVICIATGPSLTQVDVDRCRGHRVIVVNDAYTLAPWADVLWACDAKWWNWPKNADTVAFAGLKFAMESKTKPAPFALRPDIQLLRNLGPDGLSLDPTGLKTGSNSGYQAINLAVLLGAFRIVLLGYDMQLGPNKQMHCHPNHPDKSGPNFLDCLKAFATLVEPLKANGIEIFNCTRSTALRCFQTVSLEEALMERAA